MSNFIWDLFVSDDSRKKLETILLEKGDLKIGR